MIVREQLEENGLALSEFQMSRPSQMKLDIDRLELISESAVLNLESIRILPLQQPRSVAVEIQRLVVDVKMSQSTIASTISWRELLAQVGDAVSYTHLTLPTIYSV